MDMQNEYFLGFASGKSKKTGNPFWCIRTLGLNNYGQVDVIPTFFQNQDDFEFWQALDGLVVGCAVEILERRGKVSDIKVLADVPPLVLQ